MVSALGVVRIVCHVLVVVLLVASISIALAAILTTGWQTFTDSGTNEIHQHGLWFDYTYAKQHVAGKEEKEWQWRYKFGQAVEGDDDHRWRPYQYNALILICVATLLAFISLLLSYMAPYFVPVAIIWIIVTIFPVVLAAVGVILFFTEASLPVNNHVNIDRRINIDISYSFYLAVVATAGYALALLTAIGAGIIDILMARRGERPSLRDTYFRVSTKTTRTTRQNNTSV